MSSQAGTPAAPRLQLDYQVPGVNAWGTCFPSGLKVVGVERTGTGTATAVWIIDAGQASDPPGQGGSMHLIEHLWFRSHPKKGAEYRDASWGLDPGAQTDLDHTAFYATSAATELDKLLDLHSWVLAAPLYGVDEATFAAELDVVRQEAWYRGGHSESAALRTLDAVLYPVGHPYHDATAAPEELDGLTLESVTAVAVDRFRPDGATLYIEADLPPDQIEAIVKKTLPTRLTAGTGSNCNARPTAPVPETGPGKEVFTLRGPRWRPVMYLGWALPPMRAQDEALLDLGARLLEWNIFMQLQGVTGLKRFESTEDVDCGAHRSGLATTMVCTVDLPEGVDPTAVARAARRGLGDAGNAATVDWFDGFTLGDTAHRLRTDWLLEHESQDAEAVLARALHTHFDDSVGLLMDRVQGMSAIQGPTSVAAFLGKWVTRDRMAAVYLEPGAGPALDLERISGQARLPVPSGVWAPPPGPRGLTVRTLDNGAEAWMLQRANAPVAQVDVVFAGGRMREPSPGSNAVLSEIARYSMPGVNFGDLQEKVGVITMDGYGDWTNRFTAYGTAGNLDAQLWATRVMADGQVWDISERQSGLDQAVEWELANVVALPEVFAQPRAYAHLFPGHRAAMTWWERNRAGRTVRDDRLRSWRNAVYRPEGAKVLVVSSLPTDEVEPLVAKYLGKLKGHSKEGVLTPADPLPPPPERRAFGFEYNGTISAVSAFCRVPGYGPDSLAATLVAREALDHALFESLRTEGGSYSPTASIDPLTPDLAVLELQAEVAPPDAGNAARAMVSVLEALTVGDQDAFVAAAVRQARARWGRQWASAAGAESALDLAATWDIRPEQLVDVDAQMARITAADVATLLADCTGHEAITVIGNGATRQLQAAGLEAEDIPWRAQADQLLEDIR